MAEKHPSDLTEYPKVVDAGQHDGPPQRKNFQIVDSRIKETRRREEVDKVRKPPFSIGDWRYLGGL